jgi:hypothetical protein
MRWTITTLALFLTAWALFGPRPTAAQGKPPELIALYPAGARQGTTCRVSALGTFERWPVRGWCDDPALSVVADTDKGMLWVGVADDAPPGLRWIRLADDEGATAPRPFLVGNLPEVRDIEPNDDPSRAQLIDRANVAVTINGRLERDGDVDGFAVDLRRGETLVASLEANRRLGSPMDGVLQVATPDGFVLAHNDDDHERDPQLVFEAPADGRYVVRVFALPVAPNVKIVLSGAESFIYRLTLTTRGFLDHPYPQAVSRHDRATARIAIAGWNIPEPARMLTLSPSVPDPTADEPGAEVVPLSHPGLGNDTVLRLLDHPGLVEAEPNPPESPQDVSPPISVSGHIDFEGDADVYRFRARAGMPVAIRVDSRSLGAPIDPTLHVLDAEGRVVAEVDDSDDGRDAALRFNAPADGDYGAVVRDLNGASGPRAVYLLTIAPVVPDVRLSLAAERFTLAPKPGESLKIPVTVERLDGFARPIEIDAVGLPPGVISAPVVSEPAGESARSVTLTLTLGPNTGPFSGPFRIIGRVRDGQSSRSRTARAPLSGSGGGRPRRRAPARGPSADQFWLTVGKSVPETSR